MSDPERLEKQLAFLVEVDKLKHIFRQTLLINGERHENDAEHSWHLALMAGLLVEYAAEPTLDLMRVMRMVIVHDLVEIDAGDTYCYDVEGNRDKAEREQRAAERIFGLLPPDQGKETRTLWDEFESQETPEAKYAAALDRLQPLLHNYYTGGRKWQEHGVRRPQVIERNRHIADGAPQLWEYARQLIDDAVARGMLEP